MNFQEPLRISNIDFDSIVYPKSRISTKKKIVLIKYNEKEKIKNFVFQTPTLLNLSKSEFKNGYSEIEIALKGKEKQKVNKFINFLNNLENKIKEDAQNNATNWFNIDNNNQTINFQKIIRESDDYQNGTIKIKIIKNNDFETIIQMNNNKRTSLDKVPDDSWCKMILEVYAIWINANNDFGLFFRPILISFTPREKQIYNYKLLEDSEDEANNDNEFDIPETEVNNNIFMKIEPVNRKNSNHVDSTSQLDLNEFNINNSVEDDEENEEQVNTSDIKSKLMNTLDKNIINIDIDNNFLSDEDTSEIDDINKLNLLNTDHN